MKILILEDDNDRFKSMKRGLIGHSVTRVVKADDAIKKIDTGKYDVIMLDHDLADEHYEYYVECFGHRERKFKEATGMKVVDWLAEDRVRRHLCRYIIIHSLNAPMSVKMFERLNRMRYNVYHAPACWNIAHQNNVTILELLGIS